MGMKTSDKTEQANLSAPDVLSNPADRQVEENLALENDANSQRVKRRQVRDKYAANTAQLRRRIYEFTELSEYTWRERFNIYLADLFFYLLIRIISLTMRWDIRGLEHLDSIYKSGHRAIFTFWHSCIFTATYVWRKRGIVVMSSQSKDGEFTSRFIKRFGYGTSRGSATRGAGRALAEMTECLSNGIDVAFTIDGPKGPAYVAKPGAVTLARHSSQAIFPFYVAVRRYIELPSWDRLQIPLPFTRAVTFIAEPIYVPRNASSEEVAASQTALQNALDDLRRTGELWRTGGKDNSPVNSEKNDNTAS
jgi:lysophospholipid acyltransferase (LPLAT)-like uncharacterized protein